MKHFHQISRTLVFTILFCALINLQCTHEPNLIESSVNSGVAGTTPIPAYQQRDGDPEAGLEYLIYGDYVSSGIPYESYIAVIPPNNKNYLNRTGDNESIAHEFTAIDAKNGVRIVTANCLQCHANVLNGEFVMGLGAAEYDFTYDLSILQPVVSGVIEAMFGTNSPEWEAYDPLRKAISATGPFLVTETVGSNPADKIALILAAHRDRWTLEWSDEPIIEIPELVPPIDVPAWWLLKKKNAMFYAAIGREDFCRFMMASSLLTMQDSSKATEVDQKFGDVLAYINTLEAPIYPHFIDQDLAQSGKFIFENDCSKCHGTYGNNETYPNLLVSLSKVGTDPLLSEASQDFSFFLDWFNSGWFGQTTPGNAILIADGGYIAPPLDGIWATAPYLHNGSVPTLSTLLNSPERPILWQRNYFHPQYDPQNVGWEYIVRNQKLNQFTYDTRLEGYGNEGHTFGDHLTDDERMALIEYLKTL